MRRPPHCDCGETDRRQGAYGRRRATCLTFAGAGQRVGKDGPPSSLQREDDGPTSLEDRGAGGGATIRNPFRSCLCSRLIRHHLLLNCSGCRRVLAHRLDRSPTCRSASTASSRDDASRCRCVSPTHACRARSALPAAPYASATQPQRGRAGGSRRSARAAGLRNTACRASCRRRQRARVHDAVRSYAT